MADPQKTAAPPRQRPKIKSSFGLAINKVQQAATEPSPQDISIPVSQSPDRPVDQDTGIPAAPKKTTKEKRAKKGVYLKPATAKWLDIQAATEGREISEITEEALILLQKVRAGKAEIIEV